VLFRYTLRGRADEAALVNRSLSQHPGVGPVWTAAGGRIMQERMRIMDVEYARRIPLPDSPPSSPTIAPRRW
jgi:hypothetical protein